MSTITENLEKIRKELPEHVKLVAVSKTHPAEIVLEAYHAGQRCFGENKAQELISKQPELPEDIEWHFIGHLQRNKVKFLVPFITLIESVDSYRLLKEINKQAGKVDRTIDCLLQFHIATEQSKFGLDRAEATEMLDSEAFQEMENVRICGVMGMATFTENMEVVSREFHELKSIFDWLKVKYFKDNDDFKEISMGMTGDYHTAIKAGSTMVRIGTAIFGERNYQ